MTRSPTCSAIPPGWRDISTTPVSSTGCAPRRALPDAARTEAFEELDEDFVRAGAAAPFAIGVSTDFFSDRIGCQVHQPVYGISLGALCIRK